jgi:TolA-binding protein
MGIAIVIIAGLVVMTVVAAGFDFLSRKSRSSAGVASQQLKELEERIKTLEINETERMEQIRKIQDEVKFVNRLLEDKTGNEDLQK